MESEDSDTNFLSTVTGRIKKLTHSRRSKSPVPSERSQGSSSRSFVQKIFRSKNNSGRDVPLAETSQRGQPSDSTSPAVNSSNPLEYPGPPATLRSQAATNSQGDRDLDDQSSSQPPAPSTDRPGPPALSSSGPLALATPTQAPCVHSPSLRPVSDASTEPPTLSGSRAPASLSELPNLDDVLHPQSAASNIATIESSGIELRQDQGSDSTTKENTAQANAGPPINDYLKLTGRALKTLVTKAADVVDNSPAKIALGLVKCIIEISDTVKGNKDTVARQIISTGAQLKEVERALGDWHRKNRDVSPWMENFRTTLANELQGLESLRDESNLRKFLDHEDEQARIKDIFVRINEARVQFELALNLRVYKAVYEINQDVRTLILKHLDPSEIAHHDYILEGAEGQLLRRQVCTPGTRRRILDDIIGWAKDTSSDRPNVYWLFGHAGSGKSTIAYTIAQRFEFAGDPSDTIVLGGNFMCSRQFERTRLSKYIIRTIVYHLALKCKPFADALIRSGRLDTIVRRSLTLSMEPRHMVDSTH